MALQYKKQKISFTPINPYSPGDSSDHSRFSSELLRMTPVYAESSHQYGSKIMFVDATYPVPYWSSTFEHTQLHRDKYVQMFQSLHLDHLECPRIHSVHYLVRTQKHEYNLLNGTQNTNKTVCIKTTRTSPAPNVHSLPHNTASSTTVSMETH